MESGKVNTSYARAAAHREAPSRRRRWAAQRKQEEVWRTRRRNHLKPPFQTEAELTPGTRRLLGGAMQDIGAKRQ
jgi:hypothetical protein